MIQDLFALLKDNSYPGRGILLGRSLDGDHGVVAYFIMGRSQNSRNRVFVRTEDGIRTEAYDSKKMEDPSLIIYPPIRYLSDGKVVVTNGDHTNTICEALEHGHCYRHGILERTFEPDEPNWTPRISGVLLPNGGRMLSIIKSVEGDPGSCCRFFFEYENPPAGTGHFISTYEHDGTPLPSFSGEPVFCALPQKNVEALAEALWASLNPSNRISLYAAWIDLKTRAVRDVILNANQ